MSSLCPACRAHSKVVDSRAVANGVIRRRRQCLRCARRWTTVEIDADAAPDPTLVPVPDKDLATLFRTVDSIKKRMPPGGAHG